ncbi:hypothetical protein [Candidatus Caldatribacterium sp.]|uniref:hypothetical protein n=1 Tax=Candidatus Caldatribacterium sp. TaxID=2282143 RepID=UPI003841EE92|nr:hypothetical protein [Candidatus Caldatribacterium sp.]
MLGLKDVPVVNIDEEDKKAYKELGESEEIFRNADAKDIFIIAVGLGVHKGLRKPIQKKHSGGFFRGSYLREEDEALLAAVAVYATSVDVLCNEREVVEIAEEYAHGGVQELLRWVQSSPFECFEKDFEREIVELIEEFLKDDATNT